MRNQYNLNPHNTNTMLEPQYNNRTVIYSISMDNNTNTSNIILLIDGVKDSVMLREVARSRERYTNNTVPRTQLAYSCLVLYYSPWLGVIYFGNKVFL